MGVLIITYASIAGLGLSAFMGIHFNAATTQVVFFCFLIFSFFKFLQLRSRSLDCSISNARLGY